MSSRERILAASQRHIQLTQQIAPVSSSPEELIRNQDFIFQTSGKLAARKNILKSLEIASERLYQEYKAHESSFGKRLLMKTGVGSGSRAKKMEESKKKWEEARLREQEEQETISKLEVQLFEAQERDSRLKVQKAEFESLGAQLDELNNSLFQESGEFPIQDAASSDVKVLVALSVLLQAESAREKRAREKVAKAIPSIESATKDLQKALGISVDSGVPTNQKYTKQVFSGAGANTTSKGAAPLILNAKTHSGRAHTLWAEARGTQSLVKSLLPLEIIESYLLPGKGSPRAVDERGLHSSLERSYAQGRANVSHSKSELSSSKSRSQFFQQRSQLLKKQLLESRNSLNRVRSAIVNDIAHGGDGKGLKQEDLTPNSSLDKDQVKFKALEALREIMREVQADDTDEFAELPGYHYWPGT